jgi:hypothetical protein
VQEGLTTLCKGFELSHRYWAGIPQSSPTRGTPEGKRLKLLSVREKSCGIALPPYTFSYIGPAKCSPEFSGTATARLNHHHGKQDKSLIKAVIHSNHVI